MHHKAFGVLGPVFVLSAMLGLSLGYIQAQPVTPGQIVKWLDEKGNLTDSVIAESDAGNLGIGITDPEEKLHVAGNIKLTNNRGLIGREGLDRYNLNIIKLNTVNGVDVGEINTNYISFGVGGALQAMRIANGGNVGIGTTTPTSRLHVAGRVLANGYDMPSDLRLKEDITPLTGVLAKLDKIRGVSFKWNAQSEALGRSKGRREIGVIAQEVGVVFPELVIETGPENYRAVDYSKLTAVLIEAVKELKAENESLKHRIEALESK